MKLRKETDDNTIEHRVYLSEHIPHSYQIDTHPSDRLRTILKKLHVEPVLNEYGDCIISGRRIC